MIMGKKHRIYKNSSEDYEKQRHDQLIEWLKNGYGEYAAPRAPSHSYNAVVYVKDPTTAIGLTFYMHTLGYKVSDMYIQPWNISRMMHLDNRFFTLIGNDFSGGGYFDVHGQYMIEQEIRDGIDDYIKDVKESISRRTEEELTYFDRDFMARPVINCGSNYKMFKIVCEWDNNDFHSRLLVNSRNPEHPSLDYPARNTDSIEDYHRVNPKTGEVIDWYREATIDDVIEYFTGKGNWNHTNSYKEKVNGETRTILFEDDI